MLLPWERRRRFLDELLSGRRWRGTLALLALGTLVVAAFRVADERARVRTTRATMAEVHRAVSTFRAEVGRCPRSTLELVHPPRTGARYLDQSPVDGWGHPLYVRCPSRYEPSWAEVISAGPSGSFLVDDNVY